VSSLNVGRHLIKRRQWLERNEQTIGLRRQGICPRKFHDLSLATLRLVNAFAYQSPHLGRPIAGRPNEIALGDQREAEPIPERSKCGPFLWTLAH